VVVVSGSAHSPWLNELIWNWSVYWNCGLIASLPVLSMKPQRSDSLTAARSSENGSALLQAEGLVRRAYSDCSHQ